MDYATQSLLQHISDNIVLCVSLILIYFFIKKYVNYKIEIYRIDKNTRDNYFNNYRQTNCLMGSKK